MKKVSFYLLSCFFAFCSCSSESESEPIPIIDTSMISGSWCSIDDQTGDATYIIFSEAPALTYTGILYKDIYKDPKESVQIEGRWAFYPSNQVLKLSERRKILGEGDDTYTTSESIAYTILDIDDYSMRLRNQRGDVFTYNRVIKDVISHTGCTINLDVDRSKFSENGYGVGLVSSNNAIFQMSDDYLEGKIVGLGTAFISVQYLAKTIAYLKVNVTSRIPDFEKELYSSFDEIKKIHGEPDEIEDGKYSFLKTAYFYKEENIKDNGIIVIVYDYAEATGNISDIYVYYRNSTGYDGEIPYLIDNLSYTKEEFEDGDPAFLYLSEKDKKQGGLVTTHWVAPSDDAEKKIWNFWYHKVRLIINPS